MYLNFKLLCLSVFKWNNNSLQLAIVKYNADLFLVVTDNAMNVLSKYLAYVSNKWN